MGLVSCRACKGSGAFYTKSGKRLDCKACNGSGINRDLWSTNCQYCRTEIVYKASSPTPRFCKNCRSIQLEKNCAQYGCNNTIRYQVGWDNVPSYCKRCETKQREGWSATTCSGTGLFGCGKLIWSPPGKRFDLCPDCSARKKAEDAAKWKEKSCPGLKDQGYCGKTIRYRIDWDKVPDICPDCREKAKKARAEREAKMREKPCATSGCSNIVKYNIDWDHPPSFCKSCSEQRVKVDRNDRGTLQARTKTGELLFTFGRCSPPKDDRHGGDADRRREWANRGYYWVALPGNPHETFIVDSNPVVDGFISSGNVKDVSFSSATLRSTWAMLAIAVVNS